MRTNHALRMMQAIAEWCVGPPPFRQARTFDRLRMSLSEVEWVKAPSMLAVSVSNPSRGLLCRVGACLYVQENEEKPDGATGSFREWGVKLVGGSFLWYDHFGIWRG